VKGFYLSELFFTRSKKCGLPGIDTFAGSKNCRLPGIRPNAGVKKLIVFVLNIL
jgi:hypothetical protein